MNIKALKAHLALNVQLSNGSWSFIVDACMNPKAHRYAKFDGKTLRKSAPSLR